MNTSRQKTNETKKPKFCPITKKACRPDCAWAVAGCGEVDCAIALMSDRIAGVNHAIQEVGFNR